jgi:nitroreductase
MDAMEALKGRRSIRRYQVREVPRDVIREILDAARLAPSANNVQPWEFIVVTDQESRTRIAKTAAYGPFIEDSGACIVVVAKESKHYIEDGAAATENILIAAHALGLGTCWVAGYKKDYAAPIMEMLGVPNGFRMVSIIALGWPDEKPEPHGKRALDEVIHWKRF